MREESGARSWESCERKRGRVRGGEGDGVVEAEAEAGKKGVSVLGVGGGPAGGLV